MLESLEKESSERDRILARLAGARICGDVRKLKHQHEDLLRLSHAVIEKKLGFDAALSYEQVELQEQTIREANYLMLELNEALPDDDVDTSFFGYTQADKALREWHHTGRAAEANAKAKRKRDREETAGSTKKSKKN